MLEPLLSKSSTPKKPVHLFFLGKMELESIWSILYPYFASAARVGPTPYLPAMEWVIRNKKMDAFNIYVPQRDTSRIGFEPIKLLAL